MRAGSPSRGSRPTIGRLDDTSMHPRLCLIGLNLGLAAVYALAALLGLAFDPMAGFATLVWPPAGIALAAVLLLGNRVAPAVLLGSCAASLSAEAPVVVALGFGIGSTFQVLAGATLMRRVPSFTITLERVTTVVALVAGAAVVCTTISATIGVASLYTTRIVPPSQLSDAWREWWVGGMVGILLVTPLLLAWSTTPRARREIHWLEKTALVASLAVVSALTFFDDLLHAPRLATPFDWVDLLVVVLLCAAIRFGQRGATTAVLGVSVTAIVATTRGHGPFALPDPSAGLLLLQTYMAIVAATCLMFGATIAERRIANQEARHARELAETANRAKSQFLAVMSHELRTPLNAIQGFAELLESGVYGALNEKQTDAVHRIAQNEKNLLALINEMLGFVDAEKGPLEGESEDVRVADAFDGVERLIRQEVARKHLVMQREVAEPRLAVHANPKALQQILASLLSNATKFSSDGGTITLGAAGDQERVRVWIRDAGIGIRHEEIERIFEPFFQADSGTTRQYSGVGLGLTIARNLAQRMSGEVTIASEVGKGTTATVVLPAASTKTAGVAEERPVREVAA